MNWNGESDTILYQTSPTRYVMVWFVLRKNCTLCAFEFCTGLGFDRRHTDFDHGGVQSPEVTAASRQGLRQTHNVRDMSALL